MDQEKRELIANELRGRIREYVGQQLGGLDFKRPKAWANYGYKEHLSFDDFYRLWRRGGIARAVVSRTISKCWQTMPEVIQGPLEDNKDRPATTWERMAAKAIETYHLFEQLKEADQRRLVGGWSALILQVADNKTWEEELTKNSTDKRLVRVIPAWAGQLKVSEWDTDEFSERYGLPVQYSFVEIAVGADLSKSNPAQRTLTIHHSRVVLVGDMHSEPIMEASFNSFVDMEKIQGGSGESFLKNASRQLAINFAKDVDLAPLARSHGVKLSQMQEVFDDITANMNMGVDQSILTQGAEVVPLVATVPDPEEHFAIALQTALAPWMIPTKIVVGNQAGERASSDDKREWAETCQQRRTGDINIMLRDFFGHLLIYGLLKPAGKSGISFRWDDLGAATEAERMQKAKDMAEINAKNAITGEITYPVEEIRDASGHDNNVTPQKIDQAGENDDGSDKDKQTDIDE